MNVLITGGAGFIGSHLVDSLIKRGDRVTILDNFSTGKMENIAHARNQVKVVEGSVLDTRLLKKIMSDVEVIFHGAAVVGVVRAYKNPLQTLETNLKGTINTLEIARKYDIQKFVFASSSEVYGETDKIPIPENHPLSPISAYGVAKVAGEHYCKAYNKTHGLGTVIIRYFNVYGPRQDIPGWVAPNFALRVLKGKPPLVHGDGSQTRDFTYITDAINGTLLAMEKRRAVGETFNVGTGKETNIKKLAYLFIELAEKDLKPVCVKPRPLDISRRSADITKATKLLGYRPKVSLKEGIKRTIEFYRTRH
jgi:UDP-glucose 4-epimerase